MHRREITVPGCSAHLAKGEEVAGSVVMSIGEHAWDLCPEHADRFVNQFLELFGNGEKEEEAAA